MIIAPSGTQKKKLIIHQVEFFLEKLNMLIS